MKVADAGIIAHAMYFRFQLFLYHQLVMELVGHPGGIPGGPGSPGG